MVSIKQKHDSQASEAALTRLEVDDGHDHTNDEPIYFNGARFYLLWTS
jgi:hypothetical protein